MTERMKMIRIKAKEQAKSIGYTFSDPETHTDRVFITGYVAAILAVRANPSRTEIVNS